MLKSYFLNMKINYLDIIYSAQKKNSYDWKLKKFSYNIFFLENFIMWLKVESLIFAIWKVLIFMIWLDSMYYLQGDLFLLCKNNLNI